MSRRLSGLAARVRRLADALAGLRERVRAAVAAELASAVGAAVRDLVRALAEGRDAPPAAYSRSEGPDRDWDDDPWGDGRGTPPSDRWSNEDDFAADAGPPSPRVTRLAGAVAAAAAVARWWAARPGLPPLAAAVLAALAGAAAWWGGPLAHAALAAVAAAADLVAVGRPDPTPIP